MTFKQEKVGAGRTATIYRHGPNRVVKLFRANFPKEAIEEEFEIGRCLNAIGLTVLKTYDLINIEGCSGILLDYAEGRSMLQNLATQPWMVVRCAKMMGRLHFEIHQSKISHCNVIKPLKEYLAEKIARVNHLSAEERKNIISLLSKLPGGSVLCHGDFHPDNIIMSNNRMITVDWITARTGNPLGDVARTWLLLTMGTLPEGKSAIELFLAKYLRDLFCRTYLNEYFKLSTFSRDELQCWKVPVAAARLIENVSAQENQNLLKFIRTAYKWKASLLFFKKVCPCLTIYLLIGLLVLIIFILLPNMQVVKHHY